VPGHGELRPQRTARRSSARALGPALPLPRELQPHRRRRLGAPRGGSPGQRASGLRGASKVERENSGERKNEEERIRKKKKEKKKKKI